ncbi:bacteriohemerythrin [Pelotalea chapellei]|uniref:Bacteriohemerythrin n=1 Tax=Pelotalea chapellei TaxID=44671 RepID=A0ABS5UBQ1_9BACT|nr:bacteriohemerythrin [Pelotalea chapellei]MBT1073106.1 bacteriohemerythrin [Pelotalea chapellei]
MFSHFSIATKMIATFLAIIVLTTLVGIFAIVQNGRLLSSAKSISDNDIPSIQAITAIDGLVGSHRRGEMLMLLATDKEAQEKYLKRNDETVEKLGKEQAVYEKLLDTEAEKKGYAEFKTAWGAYLAEYPKIKELVLQNKSREDVAAVVMGGSSTSFNQSLKALDSLKKLIIEQSGRENARAVGIAQTTRNWIIALLCLSVLIGTAMVLFFARAISAPLKRLTTDAEQVASGDLGVIVQVESQDEIGQLATSFEKMVNNLREMIGMLADSSSQVSESSSEMEANAVRMAEGAEVVAGQAITVATASEEMSATSGDIAQNCQMAAESAQRADQAAVHGAAVVEKSIKVMHRIAERVQSSAATVEELGRRSDQIGSIISTIEDIADQTNLLALNAAIEAARAGEQGRGFAVVADEVRALAERTTKATREIGLMIKAIQQETKTAVAAMEEGVAEVEQGTEEAARSGEALSRIQDEINAVNLQVQQIATAAEEQTATTSEISSNIHQITDVAQNTVEGARKTSSTAQHLSRLAVELERLVGQFKLAGSGKLINWSPSYSVGVAAMDKEHQRLIDIINNLYSSMRSGRGNGAIGTILDELVNYTKNHFANEERLMREVNYTGFDEQKRAHEALIGQVVEIQGKFKAGTALSQEVLSFLKSWLVNHIQGMDKGYSTAMQKKGIR